MMFTTMEFPARTQFGRAPLELSIEKEWLVPMDASPERAVTETDPARAQLIRDLMGDLGVNAESVGVVLNLVGQAHGLREVLAEVVASARASMKKHG